MASPPIQTFSLHNFTFQNGTTLPTINLAYQILNPHNTKIAIVHTCFQGRINNTLTHAQGALRNHKIIVIALLGNGESSSPSNTPNFPKTIDYPDCVKAQHILLTQELGLKEVDVMLGFSMGGQITYHWLATHPAFVRNAVIVCSSAKTSRHNFQALEGSRFAFESAVDEKRGVVAFGKACSAWLTSAEWFDGEVYKEVGYESLAKWDEDVCVDGYKEWAKEDLLVMLGMWERGDVGRCVAEGRGSVEDALKTIEARVLLMPSQTDQYFHPYVSEREVKSLKRGEVKIVPSIWGHLVGTGMSANDVKWMEERINEFLDYSSTRS